MNRQATKTVRDYYTVSVPGDCCDTLEALSDQAISEARERTRLYCMPAAWSAKHVSGEPGDWEVTFRVKRERRKS